MDVASSTPVTHIHSTSDLLVAANERPIDLSGPAEPDEKVVQAASNAAALANAPAAAPADPADAPVQQTTPGSSSRAVGSLESAAAKVFAPANISVNVSYQIVHNHEEIVTVFTDPETGKVVNQVPPEILLKLAEFFDQQAGGLIDRNV